MRLMNRMVVSNFVYRPVRSFISVLAVALEVTMILLIVGFSLGTLNDSRQRQAGIGADVIVLPPASSAIVGMTGAPAPIKVGEIIGRLPHVTAVAPVLMQFSMGGGGAPEFIYGIDLKSFEGLSGRFAYLEGQPFQGPSDALVDDVFSRSKHVEVGSAIEILNHTFHVSGIVGQGKGARKFVPIATLQEMTGAKDKASVFYVKLDSPANANTVVAEVKQVPGMQQYVVRSMSEYLSMLTPNNIPLLSIFINVVIGISLVIGFLVIFQAMYAAVTERTREIGILKSIGASKIYIVSAILRETVLLAVSGVFVGVALTYLARIVFHHWLPTMNVIVGMGWMLRATLIAVFGALAGALYPAYKAAQKDPIDALAYE